MDFRKLKADEIEVRVGGQYKSGVTLLLYKNARVDMQILDETVGSFHWQRLHDEHKGVLYCGIAILDPQTNGWVAKWDAGSESYSEKEKGEASDAFKRAAVNWGIGRELYTAPFIFVKAKDVKMEDGKIKDSWTVKYIDYEEDKINCLVIANKRGENVFTYGTPKK